MILVLLLVLEFEFIGRKRRKRLGQVWFLLPHVVRNRTFFLLRSEPTLPLLLLLSKAQLVANWIELRTLEHYLISAGLIFLQKIDLAIENNLLVAFELTNHDFLLLSLPPLHGVHECIFQVVFTLPVSLRRMVCVFFLFLRNRAYRPGWHGVVCD